MNNSKYNNIILIGFMGTGKTSIGKLLASSLNMNWIDIDIEIEKKENMSVNDIFTKKGGDYFRECETNILNSLNIQNTVVSTGGGIVKNEKNREVIKTLGYIVHLKASFSIILDRVKGTHNRPLLENMDKLECVKNLWNERKNHYDIGHTQIITDNLSINEVSDLIKIKYENTFTYKTSRENTEVIIKTNIVLYFNNLLNSKTSIQSKKLIITDSKVYSLYEDLIKKMSDHIIILNEGEKLKDIKNAKKIWEYASTNGFSRNDVFIGLGGGTVCDLAGFAASNFKRGIRLFLIPTTLLCMIDASIGGKNSINFNNVKNLIGSFYQPELIVIDTLFLETLDKEDFLSGMGEMIKYSYLSNTSDIIKNDKDIEHSVILACVYKSKIVEKDELDKKGIRLLLNLGHTFGHVIESISKFEVKHGIAVCDGMYYAWKTSFLTGKITLEDFENFKIIRKNAGFCNEVFSLTEQSLFDSIELIKQDKKNIKDKICIILPVNKNNIIEFNEFYFSEFEMKKLWQRLC
ncbi:MAG: iron-containing alcohol dehydrogenase [Candidatus Muirbacterium halophilum]|nr:iron-containing alcohol dehydrogenase [Candidatus Muirbacterium halophilum]MCK9475197.1 iron-containing alcohol dehydrogenase [Candidatus Muirbacterium halophilum]